MRDAEASGLHENPSRWHVACISFVQKAYTRNQDGVGA
jgi:hypothetical protein